MSTAICVVTLSDNTVCPPFSPLSTRTPEDVVAVNEVEGANSDNSHGDSPGKRNMQGSIGAKADTILEFKKHGLQVLTSAYNSPPKKKLSSKTIINRTKSKKVSLNTTKQWKDMARSKQSLGLGLVL
jgi:hypothetical protein